MVPLSRNSSIHVSNMPGTQAASRPVPGTISRPRLRKCAIVAACRRWSLAANHFRPIAFDIIENDRHVAARPVEMRLDDLQRECRRHCSVESIAALFQRCHADRGRDPMRRRNNAKGSFDLGAGREGIGVDLGDVNFHALAM